MGLRIFLHVWFISIIMPQISSILAHHETYIIHMDLSAMPKAFSSHHNWYLNTFASVADSLSAVESSSKSSFSTSRFVYSYTNAIHGFSASLSPAELEAIKNSPGYVSSTRDMEVKVDTTHSAQFLGLNSNYGAWPDSDYGKDIIIGLVDTGIWPESKSFNDDGMSEVPSRWRGMCESGTQFNSSLCNKKLIGARYFNKGLLAKYPNLTISVNSARDTDGHGTHTSSTAAGNYVDGASYFGYASGTSRGMAPRAQVAMYKALWDQGFYFSDVIAAIDQAIMDGVDVLSLSFGTDGVELYEDPIAIAAFAALEKNIFVSTSAGNEGPLYATLHNGTPWVLTVAAGTVDREFTGTITLGNGIQVSGFSLYTGNSISTQTSMVFMNNCDDQRELKKIGDKVIVCLDKTNSLGDQVYNVQSVNATAGVFITNNIDLEFFLQSTFPALFLNLEDGEKVMNYIGSNSDPKASIEFQETHLGTKPVPKVASYSSRGPSQSCPSVMKPDLMAPGSLILASWPGNFPVANVNSGNLFGNFNIISGTSMACPHAAGVAALLKAGHPEWSPAAIRSAMMTTADVLDNTMNPIEDIGFSNQAACPLARGSGHINPNKALDPGLIYDTKLEDYINLLCALNFTSKQIQTITRSSAYGCSNPSLDLNYPSFIAYNFDANSKIVLEFQRTVTNVGDAVSVYDMKLTRMAGLEISVVPDKLVFSKKYEEKSFKLHIKVPGQLKEVVVYGSLSWVENGGKHVVTSPIVVISLNAQALS